jgi:hypothetical protein
LRGELAWLLQCLQTQGNAGPHSMTIACYSVFKDRAETSRAARTAPARVPTTAASRGHPCWLRKGRRIYLSRSASSRGFAEEKFGALSTEGARLLHQASSSRQAPWRRFRFAVVLSEGRCFYPSPGSPSRGRFVFPNRPASRGALCSPPGDLRQRESSGPFAACCYVASGPSLTGRLVAG